VEEILARRGRREGVVCILGAIERCRCFKVGKNQKTGFFQLQWSPGKCQHFYIYFLDAEFGLCHLRIPTWAPFRLQFCCNGHDWLERQMKPAGLNVNGLNVNVNVNGSVLDIVNERVGS